jgi:hypothetical protein
MKFWDIILVEYREDYIAQQMKQRLEAAVQKDLAQPLDSTQVVARLKAGDPTGKSLQWLANMYAAGQFKLEDLPRIRGEIAKFQKYRAQLPIKDLNQYRTLDALYDALDQLTTQTQPEPASRRSQEQQIKQQADKIIDTPDFKVVVPKTEAASCLYGAGTRWCTAAKDNNMFDSYAKQGPLYIIMANINGQPRKFQLSVEGDQFMNERDTEVSKQDIAALSQIPAYTDFLNQLIQKHYGRYLQDK